jgi:hypothetical protein
MIFNRIFSVGAVSALLSLSVCAQATRTWVSGVGDDANPCSRTAPCKTFAGAISKTAAGGEIDTLDPGGWGAVTITKAITIDGGPLPGGVLVASTNGINIAAGVSDLVVLRNLVIQGNGTGLRGIDITGGETVRLENVTITGMATSCVSLMSSGTVLSVRNSVFRGCGNSSGQGLAAGSVPVQQTIDVDGLEIEESATALSLGSNVSGVFRHLNIHGNILAVLADATSAPCTVSIHDSRISHNSIGVETLTGSPTVRLSNDIITLNNTGLMLGGGTIVSFGNNVISFNGVDGSPNGSAVLR